MIDGGTPDRVKQTIEGVQQLAPTVSQYPLAIALMVVVAAAVGAAWLFYRRERDRSTEVAGLTDLVRQLVAYQETQSRQLDTLVPILTAQTALAAGLKQHDLETELKRVTAEATAARDEQHGRRRGRRTTGAIPERPLPASEGTPAPSSPMLGSGSPAGPGKERP